MSLKQWMVSSSSPPSVLLMDGGVSTHLESLLQAKNQKFAHRSMWSSSLLLMEEGREIILQGHKDWLEAGSDILTTLTYQCHYGVVGQEMVVSQSQMTQLLKWGVQLARTAIDEEQKFVVASSGCYGAALADGSEYTGNYRNIDHLGLVQFHRKKIQTLLEQHPDGLAIETIPCLTECTAVCDVLSELQPIHSASAFWISLACQNGSLLNEGQTLLDALQVLREKDPNADYVHAIGINCCDIAHIASLLEILTHDIATNGPTRAIAVYPNSGEEWDAAQEVWREGTGCTNCDQFTKHMMHAMGVIEQTWKKSSDSPLPKLILGGCCRTSPESIATLRRSIDDWEKRRKECT